MTDVLARLQSSLGAAYTIERELGGGRMTRVFVACGEALGRDMVVKVIASDLAARRSADRFEHEVKLAASPGTHPRMPMSLAHVDRRAAEIAAAVGS